MDETTTDTRLLEALIRFDNATRSDRAARIEWLAYYSSRPSVIIGPMDTLHIMEEARVCFISGHFIAALLLATSFIEHTLADELSEAGYGGGRLGLAEMLKLAKEHALFPDGLLTQTNRLRELRNPYSHRRPGGDPDTLGSRFRSSRAHPEHVLEADAKLAMEAMYEYFQRTLRSA